MKKLLKLCLLISIYVVVLSSATFASFEDVEGHWAEKEINEFRESNFVEGYEDGLFKPDREITRAELAKIINSYMRYEVSGEWKSANLEMAKEKGYLTTGKADDKISREEAFVVFARLMQLDNVEYEVSYNDSDSIDAWALPAIKSLSSVKYIKGYPDNSLRPLQNITRAEVVTILYGYTGIGGVDIDVEEQGFSVGYLSHNEYGIEYVEIDDELEIEVGDIIILAATVSNDEEIEFEIVSGKEKVDFDSESLMLEALKKGKVVFNAKTSNGEDKIKFKINIK